MVTDMSHKSFEKIKDFRICDCGHYGEHHEEDKSGKKMGRCLLIKAHVYDGKLVSTYGYCGCDGFKATPGIVMRL